MKLNRRRITLIITLTLSLFALATVDAGPLHAAKGGKHAEDPTLTITSSLQGLASSELLVRVGQPFLVEGKDFQRTTAVFLTATGPIRDSTLVGTDRAGYFATTWSIDVPGEYMVEACQYLRKSWQCHLGTQFMTVSN